MRSTYHLNCNNQSTQLGAQTLSTQNIIIIT